MKNLQDILRESTEGLSEEDTKDFIVDMLIDLAGSDALNEEGEFNNPSLGVIAEMIEVISGSQLDYLAHMIDEQFATGIFDEEGSTMDVPEDLVGEEYEDEELDEKILSQKERRSRALKQKKKKKLGKKADTMSFKRNFFFDKKKKKFVRRKKSMSVTTLRKKAKRLKKLVRRGSTKAKTRRTKKRLSHMAKIRV